jgi:hypothetical protein
MDRPPMNADIYTYSFIFEVAIEVVIGEEIIDRKLSGGKH